jgi:hypothetical protein
MKTKKSLSFLISHFSLFIVHFSLFIVLCSLLFANCVSVQTANPDEVSLNTAIRQAADRMESRLDKGTKVALINFTSPSQAFSEYVLDELSSVLVNSGQLTVVDRANLDKIRQELGFNTSGEVSDKSMQEIGKMLGAQAIVTGSLTSIGDLRRIMFKTIMTETAAVVVQHPADIVNDTRITALLAQGGGSRAVTYNTSASGGGQAATASGGRTQTQSTSGGQTAASSAAQTPAAGTYTFWPRIRAYQNGIPINVYIYRIVIRGRNILFYLGDNPRGPSHAVYGLSGSWILGGSILTNLDRPSQSWRAVNAMQSDNENIGTVINSFENINGNRFSLSGSDNIIFEEINLANAEYEP